VDNLFTVLLFFICSFLLILWKIDSPVVKEKVLTEKGRAQLFEAELNNIKQIKHNTFGIVI
jgi:hypothetical protein